LGQGIDEQDRRIEIEHLGRSRAFGDRAPAECSAGVGKCQHPLVTVFAGLVEPVRNGLVPQVFAKGLEIHAIFWLKRMRPVNSCTVERPDEAATLVTTRKTPVIRAFYQRLS